MNALEDYENQDTYRDKLFKYFKDNPDKNIASIARSIGISHPTLRFFLTRNYRLSYRSFIKVYEFLTAES
jgi:predicted transcriptional regulator